MSDLSSPVDSPEQNPFRSSPTPPSPAAEASIPTEGHDVAGPSQSSQTTPDDTTPLPSPKAVDRRETGIARISDDLSKKTSIQIVDAQKTTEGATSSYITYVISSSHGTTRHRYSEFEGLRTVLTKMYPCFIIPPIPPHHSIGEYAVKPSKAKEDTNVISRRKRMLQVFLNRLACHPILSEEHIFIRFLQPGVSWAEIMYSSLVNQLPKNPLRAPAEKPHEVSADLAPIYATLPLPSTSQPLMHPDERFLDSEAFTSKFASHLSNSTERVNRRLMKRWHDLGGDWSDLGATLNGFSLIEHQALAEGIERSGQAFDGNYVNTNGLLQAWERSFTEPLAEYGQFSNSIKQLLKYRHNRHAQFEMVREVLDAKRAVLVDMERSEAEAQRLEMALDKAASRVKSLNLDGDIESEASSVKAGSEDGGGAAGTNTSPQSPNEGQEQTSTSTSVQTDENRLRRPSRGRNGYGLFNAISHTFQGVMDVDPETQRRSSITKTRDTINQLETAVLLTQKDVRFASQTIQADLDRFQRQKVADLKDMTIAFARMHQQWCTKNAGLWEEAKREAEKVAEADLG